MRSIHGAQSYRSARMRSTPRSRDAAPLVGPLTVATRYRRIPYDSASARTENGRWRGRRRRRAGPRSTAARRRSSVVIACRQPIAAPSGPCIARRPRVTRHAADRRVFPSRPRCERGLCAEMLAEEVDLGAGGFLSAVAQREKVPALLDAVELSAGDLARRVLGMAEAHVADRVCRARPTWGSAPGASGSCSMAPNCSISLSNPARSRSKGGASARTRRKYASFSGLARISAVTRDLLCGIQRTLDLQ